MHGAMKQAMIRDVSSFMVRARHVLVLSLASAVSRCQALYRLRHKIRVLYRDMSQAMNRFGGASGMGH